MTVDRDQAFFEWLSPNCLNSLVEDERRGLAQMALKRPGKKFREAYVACRFAAFRKADTVRLLPERATIGTPDFALKIGANEQRFEITEADRPGRKRGNECHTPDCRHLPVPPDEWTDPEEYQALVECRARSKAAKTYDCCHGLITWSNAWPIADREKLTSEWWRTACRPAEHAFAEVWVGTSSELHHTFHRVF